jgi:GTP cyclohydrolase I
MTARGARKPGATMYTCELLGALREQPATRAEFLDLTRARR